MLEVGLFEVLVPDLLFGRPRMSRPAMPWTMDADAIIATSGSWAAGSNAPIALQSRIVIIS